VRETESLRSDFHLIAWESETDSFTRVRSKSLISKKIDRPQPVPSNQLDPPQASRLEAITHNSMFADYLHSENIRSQTVKDRYFFQYKAKPDLRH
jgi:hypothetical protein